MKKLFPKGEENCRKPAFDADKKRLVEMPCRMPGNLLY